MRPWGIAIALGFSVLGWPAQAWADPAVPQADTPCTADFAGAMTWPANDKMPLVCAGEGGGYRWTSVSEPPAPSDRWVSYGPPMRLHGEGLRNPSVKSGNWTATPLDPNSTCRAEQLVVVKAGVLGDPQIAEAGKGQPLSFQVPPRLFSITMSGYCMWTRVVS